jgi:hypothetical protein
MKYKHLYDNLTYTSYSHIGKTNQQIDINDQVSLPYR